MARGKFPRMCHLTHPPGTGDHPSNQIKVSQLRRPGSAFYKLTGLQRAAIPQGRGLQLRGAPGVTRNISFSSGLCRSLHLAASLPGTTPSFLPQWTAVSFSPAPWLLSPLPSSLILFSILSLSVCLWDIRPSYMFTVCRT